MRAAGGMQTVLHFDTSVLDGGAVGEKQDRTADHLRLLCVSAARELAKAAFRCFASKEAITLGATGIELMLYLHFNCPSAVANSVSWYAGW